ncbi:MAG: hypothetical protein M1831_005987 [Alyxoria varia]|nr:MAG: hypothetical protein M1831_005987 [Alyxoria varia]
MISLFKSLSVLFTFIILALAAPTPSPVEGQCDDQGHCYGFGDYPAPSPTPPPPPPPDRDPNDGANEVCAPDRVETKITVNSWQMNYGNGNPWDMIASIGKNGGPCDEYKGECSLGTGPPQDARIIPGPQSQFDSCPQCGMLPRIFDYSVTFEVVEATVRNAEDIHNFVAAMQVAMEHSITTRVASSDRLAFLDQPDNPDNFAQNFAPNYIAIQRWDGNNPCGNLAVKAKSEPKNKMAASFVDAGLEGEMCQTVSNSILTIGTALSAINPPLGIALNFFGLVSANCHTLT